MFFISSLDLKLLADFCDNQKKYVVNLHAIFLAFNVFLGYLEFVTAAIFTAVIDVFLGIEMADAGTHRIKITNLCPFCGKTEIVTFQSYPQENPNCLGASQGW